jgi:hypothetical protein
MYVTRTIKAVKAARNIKDTRAKVAKLNAREAKAGVPKGCRTTVQQYLNSL